MDDPGARERHYVFTASAELAVAMMRRSGVYDTVRWSSSAARVTQLHASAPLLAVCLPRQLRRGLRAAWPRRSVGLPVYLAVYLDSRRTVAGMRQSVSASFATRPFLSTVELCFAADFFISLWAQSPRCAYAEGKLLWYMSYRCKFYRQVLVLEGTLFYFFRWQFEVSVFTYYEGMSTMQNVEFGMVWRGVMGHQRLSIDHVWLPI